MGRILLLKRWQGFNPVTGNFDLTRTNREYAQIIGVHESYLSKCYAGLHPVGMKALSGLVQAFPQAAGEVGIALGDRPLLTEAVA